MSNYDIWNVADPYLNLDLSDKYKINLVKDYMFHYFLSNETIHTIKRSFEKELEDGLKRFEVLDTVYDKLSKPQNPNTLGMKVTFFTEFFNGTEKGEFIVIYLSRRHLLLMLAKVRPGFPVETKRDYFIVDDAIRRSPYIKIFEYICDCLIEFFSKHGLLNKTQTVGFCSDLPFIQFGIDHAIVWYFSERATDFPLNCYDINRCFEIVMLKEKYHQLKIKLVVLLSNNTSMFINSCYLCGNIDMFLNFADDCDLLYLERPIRVNKWKVSDPEVNGILIDTELRNFGGNGCLDFIATDLEWLAITTSDKRARIEKFVTEQYLLQLIKHILIDLHHRLLYCRNTTIESLQSNGISLTELCDFANVKDLGHAATLLPGGTIGGSLDDAKIAMYVCKVLLIRAAVLTSVCISSVLLRFLREDFIIAVNSPMLRKHPDYETYIRNLIGKFAPEKKFQFLWTEDSFSFNGAALATSIANRLDRTKLHF
ncbi:phosphotransferase [Trichonephila clavata]|uniref:Phosphotransferase n=1 Tax=Trichonephila clavata TaxID=2740835 RepID=A0A8X6LSV1_TRICU|nr:phosphotransferase [Trichonephila clavata]